MKIRILEQAAENILCQISVSWCGACYDRSKELADAGVKHHYINPEEKFVVKFNSLDPERGDINLAKAVLKAIGEIEAYPTFAVYKKDGTIEVGGSDPWPLVNKYRIGRWK